MTRDFYNWHSLSYICASPVSFICGFEGRRHRSIQVVVIVVIAVVVVNIVVVVIVVVVVVVIVVVVAVLVVEI